LNASFRPSLEIGFALCLAETTLESETTTLFILPSLFLTLDSGSNALAAKELDANPCSTQGNTEKHDIARVDDLPFIRMVKSTATVTGAASAGTAAQEGGGGVDNYQDWPEGS